MNQNLKQTLEEDSGSDWDSIIEPPPVTLKESLPTTKHVPESHGANISKKTSFKKTSFKKSESDPHSRILQLLDRNQKDLPPFNFKGVVSDDETGPSAKPVPPPGKPNKHQYNPSFANAGSPNKESLDNSIKEEHSQVNVGFDIENEDPTVFIERKSTFGKRKRNESWKKDIGDKRSNSSRNKKKLHFTKMEDSNLPETIDWEDRTKENIQDQSSACADRTQDLKNACNKPKVFSFNQIAKDMTCPHFSEMPGRCHFPFIHGSYECFCVAKENEGSCVDPMADKYSRKLKTIYLDIFNGIGLVFDSLSLFLLQLLRFVLASIVHPLTIGVFLVICDFLLKPTLTALFNGLLQPLLVFLWNIFVSCARLLEPFLSILAQLCQLSANFCKSVRIIEINHYHQFPSTKKTEIV